MREIDFDTDGISSDCPELSIVTSDYCFKCLWHRGHEAFTVKCDYPEGNQPDEDEKEKVPA